MSAADDADDCRRAAELGFEKAIYSPSSRKSLTLVAFLLRHLQRLQRGNSHIACVVGVRNQVIYEAGADKLAWKGMQGPTSEIQCPCSPCPSNVPRISVFVAVSSCMSRKSWFTFLGL